MGLEIVHRVTAASSADATSYTTGSFTPSANVLLVACYASGKNTTEPANPTVTGGSLTWGQQDTFWWNTDTDAREKAWVFAADTGVSPGSMTINFSHGAETQLHGNWSVFEVPGSDLASGGGASTVAQCFVQFAHSTANTVGSPLSITLAAAGAADNRPFMVGCIKSDTQDLIPQSSWTQIGEAGQSTPVLDMMTQWRSDAFDTAAAMTWASGNVRKGGIAFEVKALVSAGGAAVDPFGMSGFFGG